MLSNIAMLLCDKGLWFYGTGVTVDSSERSSTSGGRCDDSRRVDETVAISAAVTTSAQGSVASDGRHNFMIKVGTTASTVVNLATLRDSNFVLATNPYRAFGKTAASASIPATAATTGSIVAAVSSSEASREVTLTSDVTKATAGMNGNPADYQVYARPTPAATPVVDVIFSDVITTSSAAILTSEQALTTRPTTTDTATSNFGLAASRLLPMADAADSATTYAAAGMGCRVRCTGADIASDDDIQTSTSLSTTASLTSLAAIRGTAALQTLFPPEGSSRSPPSGFRSSVHVTGVPSGRGTTELPLSTSTALVAPRLPAATVAAAAAVVTATSSTSSPATSRDSSATVKGHKGRSD